MFFSVLRGLFRIPEDCPIEPYFQNYDRSPSVNNWTDDYEVKNVIERLHADFKQYNPNVITEDEKKEQLLNLLELISFLFVKNQRLESELKFHDDILVAIFGNQKTREEILHILQNKSNNGDLHLVELFNKILKLGR